MGTGLLFWAGPSSHRPQLPLSMPSSTHWPSSIRLIPTSPTSLLASRLRSNTHYGSPRFSQPAAPTSNPSFCPTAASLSSCPFQTPSSAHLILSAYYPSPQPQADSFVLKMHSNVTFSTKPSWTPPSLTALSTNVYFSPLHTLY